MHKQGTKQESSRVESKELARTARGWTGGKEYPALGGIKLSHDDILHLACDNSPVARSCYGLFTVHHSTKDSKRATSDTYICTEQENIR